MIVPVKTYPCLVQRRSHRHHLQTKEDRLENCGAAFAPILCPIINQTVSRVKATSDDISEGFIPQGPKYTTAKITIPADTKR